MVLCAVLILDDLTALQCSLFCCKHVLKIANNDAPLSCYLWVITSFRRMPALPAVPRPWRVPDRWYKQIHVDISKECSPWPWEYHERVHMWMSLIVRLHQSNSVNVRYFCLATGGGAEEGGKINWF